MTDRPPPPVSTCAALRWAATFMFWFTCVAAGWPDINRAAVVCFTLSAVGFLAAIHGAAKDEIRAHMWD